MQEVDVEEAAKEEFRVTAGPLCMPEAEAVKSKWQRILHPSLYLAMDMEEDGVWGGQKWMIMSLKDLIHYPTKCKSTLIACIDICKIV